MRKALAIALIIFGVLWGTALALDAKPDRPRVEVEVSIPKGKDGRKAELQTVVDWYAQSSGDIYDGLWTVPADPELVAKAPADILRWLEQRLEPVGVPESTVCVGSAAARQQTSVARAYLALAQRDKSGGAGAPLCRERCAVLQRSIDLMMESGEGSVLALVLHIRNLAEEYPEKWEVNALYVDFFRALTCLAESQSRRYVALMGDPPDPAFCDRALALAKSAERARMKRLHEAFEGTKTADLAAIYLAKRCSDGGPEDLREAKDLIDRHRAAWLADGAMWQRAKSALGSLLPHPPDYLKSLNFTDTTGKRWTVEDLRNKKTVFAFFDPPRREYIEKFNIQVGSRAQVIAVPMTTGPLQPGKTVTVDPHYTDVSALAKLLGVRVIPGMAVVTPQLDVISGVEEVGKYLRGVPGTPSAPSPNGVSGQENRK